MSRDYEDDLVELLSVIYESVDWRRIRTSKMRWDVWNHRVRASATRATLGEFVSRLSNYFGLQSLPPEALGLIERLRPHEQAALSLVYAEHIPISMRAALLARERITARRKAREEARHGSSED